MKSITKEKIEKKELAKMSEEELRDSKAISPNTEEELLQYIQSLLNRPHDYGTRVYAVSLASTATFNYMAHKLGISGFQAGCADLDILRRTRLMEDGFRILDYNHLLYPQYCDEEHFPSYMDLIMENLENIQKKATELLNKKRSVPSHPEVIRHWKWIVSLGK